MVHARAEGPRQRRVAAAVVGVQVGVDDARRAARRRSAWRTSASVCAACLTWPVSISVAPASPSAAGTSTLFDDSQPRSKTVSPASAGWSCTEAVLMRRILTEPAPRHHRYMPTTTLDDLRRHAVARSLFTPTTLPRAIARLGFVQADPIRAPARAQDLTLRHRVADYRAGDLERRYPRLAIEEDFFVNYGFLPRAHARADAPAHAAHGVDRRRAGRRRRRCSSSCASAAWCTRARSTPSSRTARRSTGSAARRTPARSCSTACTTAACCAWRGARAASACTRAREPTPPPDDRARRARRAGRRGRRQVRAAAGGHAGPAGQPAARRRAAVARRARRAR